MPPDIKGWNVEDGKFWESTGKRVAYRNLWISVLGLLCGFAIWPLWSGVGDSNFASSMSNSSFSSSATSTFTMWPAKPGPA